MSYTTQSYFAADAGQVVSIWLRSRDFAPKIGVGLSGSLNPDMEASNNAWLYGSEFKSAALRYTASAYNIYVASPTSTTNGKTGSFELYISPAEKNTASVSVGGYSGPSKAIVHPISNRVFTIEQNYGMATCYVTVLDAFTSTIENTFTYANTTMMDGVYNSVNGTVWVWLSGSSGEFFYEYNASGSAVAASHSVSTKWFPLPPDGVWYGTSWWGYLAHNPVDNHILICPENNGFSQSFVSVAAPLTNSIYDCNTDTVVHQYLRDNIQGVWPQYVSSSHTYYIFGNYDSTQPTIKIDATTFAQTSIPNMTGSGQGASYVAAVDKIFFENDTSTSCSVFDPATDTIVDSIPGIMEMNYVTYDPCVNCLVISDDMSSGTWPIGGLCYVTTASYQPINFIPISDGPNHISFCPDTSTVFCTVGQNATVRNFFSTRPTGSLPMPTYLPPLAAFSGSPVVQVAPATVTFTNLSIRANSYYWTFGDGDNSTSTNPTHVYVTPGVYTVNLLASGPGGANSATASNYVSASEPPPFVTASFCVPPPFQSYRISGSTIMPLIISI